MTIFQKVKKWNELNIRAKAIETLVEHKEEYIRLNKQQMYRGENKLGGNMKSYKWKEYADYKQSINNRPPSGVRDNYLHGDFYSGFYLTPINDNIFEVGSLDEKSAILENWAGGDIFGLNKKSTEELKPEFQKSFIKRVNDATS